MSWRHFGISSSYFSPSSSRDDQARLPLVSLPKLTVPELLGEDRRILRLARLEQVGDARQTAGDVAGLRGFLRDTRDDVADRHLGAVLQADDRARRQRVHAPGCRCSAKVTSLPLALTSSHGRAQVLAATALLRIEHDGAGQAGHFVDLRRDREAVDEVLELDEARHFRDDRVGMRIPGRHDLAGLDRVAFLDVDRPRRTESCSARARGRSRRPRRSRPNATPRPGGPSRAARS